MMKQQNNYDMLRLLFASMVFLNHCYDLTDLSELRVMKSLFSIEFALNAFFVISGFLICKSFESSRSVGEFFEKRARRVLPAYFAVVGLLGTAGFLISDVSLNEYFSSDLIRYFAANLTFLNFLEPTLPGVFISNHYRAANGALWTIRTEIFCYALLPVLMFFSRRYGRYIIFALCYVGAMVLFYLCNWLSRETGYAYWAQLAYVPWHFSCFLSGVIMVTFFSTVEQRNSLFLGTAVLAYIAGSFAGLAAVLPIALAVIIVTTACGLPFLGNFARFGDFSYGVYIVHFPVIQVLVQYRFFNSSPYLFVAAAAGIVLIISFISWHLVEKPFLKRTSHYVMASSSNR